ncbi:DNA recombination protein RmuC [Pseudorhodoplanes sinuspersici]|uniref:DNA recombination protein RmuC homolog n=1 Tax=Pseudorhodoplanes sinuspersici TaxID=1235591 RepID=A0A1W6ZLI9_9HYPH|nr:DNA recombination protein RmuC [Pseudorhodoplanes sinuspersici]ARP98135.1 DNA recombination protein RmuC [Pseudorhodoplanes sinuspersici]RKE68112.1 DNA recombination protein RmuC [Pseudorhodoplanes sinuspersici]
MDTFALIRDRLTGVDPLLVVAIVAAAFALVLAAVIGVAVVLMARRRRRLLQAAEAERIETEQNEARMQSEARMAELRRMQAETSGLVRAMGDMLANRQSQFEKSFSERLDAVTHRVGQSVQHSTQQTTDNLARLNERLAVIDSAQQNITALASQVTSLQSVLSNKQQRGAFGQGRMEMIIEDGLPKGTYEFQFTLSNSTRPDCVIHFPDQRPLIIDAKFPLEAVTAFRDSKSDDERNLAGKLLRQHVSKHIADIAGKYLLPGETQDLALMFVPSESVYAELHDQFDDLIQRAFRSKVVIVSPSLLMLAIQVIQQIHRDAKMREAADKIHAEVGNLMDDLRRLRDRVNKLDNHFGQANEDIRQILISADKMEKRGARIREVEFDGDDDDASAVVIPAPIGARRIAGE